MENKSHLKMAVAKLVEKICMICRSEVCRGKWEIIRYKMLPPMCLGKLTWFED